MNIPPGHTYTFTLERLASLHTYIECDPPWLNFWRATVTVQGRPRLTLTAQLPLSRLPELIKWLNTILSEQSHAPL